MSSFIIPQKIIDDFKKNLFECPYCHNLILLESKSLSDPKPCKHCDKVIMVPYKVGDFWLFKRLGGGAMGTVYMAFHEVHHRSMYAV